MITCKNCHEIIGGDVTECPFCKTEITEDDRKAATTAKEQLHQTAVENAIKEYAKRTKTRILIELALILLAMVGEFFTLWLELDTLLIVALFIILGVFYCYCIYKFRIGLCPYCESFMNRRMGYRNYCPKCGGRIR